MRIFEVVVAIGGAKEGWISNPTRRNAELGLSFGRRKVQREDFQECLLSQISTPPAYSDPRASCVSNFICIFTLWREENCI